MKVGLGKLASSTVIYGMGEVLGRFITLLLLPVFTAYLSPTDFGVISILTAFTVFVIPVCSLGLSAGIAPVYFEGNSRARKEAIINTTFTLLVTAAALLAFVGCVCSSFVSTVLLRTPDYSSLVRISMLGAALTVIATPFRQFLQFEQRATTYVVASVSSIAASTLFSVLLVVVLKRGVRGMLEAGLLGQGIAFVIFAIPAAKWIRPRASAAVAKELLRVSVPLVPAFACVFVLQNNGKYLLQWFRGLNDVGLYSVGLSAGLVISIVASAFQSAWIPYFMSFADKPAEARIVFGRVLTYYAFIVGGLALAVFAIAKPLMMVMTQPAFHASWRVVGLSATAQFLFGGFAVLLPGIYIAKEVYFIGLGQGIAAVVGVALSLLLIPPFGATGAAISLILGYLALDVIQHAWNRYRAYPEVAYEWGRMTRFTCLYLAYASIALWERNVSLFMEFGISAFLLLLLTVMIYAQLAAGERRILWEYARRLAGRGVVESPAEA